MASKAENGDSDQEQSYRTAESFGRTEMSSKYRQCGRPCHLKINEHRCIYRALGAQSWDLSKPNFMTSRHHVTGCKVLLTKEGWNSF